MGTPDTVACNGRRDTTCDRLGSSSWGAWRITFGSRDAGRASYALQGARSGRAGPLGHGYMTTTRSLNPANGLSVASGLGLFSLFVAPRREANEDKPDEKEESGGSEQNRPSPE